MEKSKPARSWTLKRTLTLAIAALVLGYLATAVWHLHKPLPKGVNMAAPWRPATSVRFHADSTWLDAEGQQHNEREIFDAAFAMIERAETLVISDFFLLNQFAGRAGDGYRPLSTQLVNALVTERQTHDSLRAVLITDPFNDLYDGVDQPLFAELERAGVEVIETDLKRLRDPNPIWSAAWRICCQWFGNGHRGGWLPNPVGEGKVTLRTYLTMLNFKANHRKTLVVDSENGAEGLVTSANPHDASSRHDNIAVTFDGPAVGDLLETERAVVRFSTGREPDWPTLAFETSRPAMAEVRVLTEAAIREAALAMIDSAEAGDSLDLLMFYLSHREIIESLIEAHERGATLRVLLDPNEDAFGRKKNGVPNRQVAWELHEAGIPIRWCNTRGEQCHGKMLILRPGSGPDRVLAGSANFTRRNLDNYNLETNIELRMDTDVEAMQAIIVFFEERWSNQPDRIHSLPYERYADHSHMRYWQYRIMEATGLSTF
ncbi:MULTISPECIES: phospholipase D-like domain-containing protein [unclassified Wenzhouxiangella]|uniref:phospholipase D-like domain-containing protein n=1 Tax=unclassified Wenzhouxiangella TaxID=2613841 RepID=UPI000E327C74|nr:MULTISPECIES: phospholipase D-like domain-containing protein [unclassified Wenzhouxiangella]RFF28037.1 phospholipase [Wenzhouxiangella sp. 15181]RFP68623.1 phospholipase [Wenzhouxiangella sp. 15190]